MSNTIEESKPDINVQENPLANNTTPEANLIPTNEEPRNEEEKVVDEVKIKQEESVEEVKEKTPKESSNGSQRQSNEADIRVIPQDEYINFGDNEAYHEKVLALLKINNNKVLNNIYKRHVPSISKNALLMYDLTLASSVVLC